MLNEKQSVFKTKLPSLSSNSTNQLCMMFVQYLMVSGLMAAQCLWSVGDQFRLLIGNAKNFRNSKIFNRILN